MTFLIFLSIIAAIVFWGINAYNGLIKLKLLCENAWSDIDVYLKKRSTLIPNLINTVKGYTKHETETFEKIVAARSKAVSSGDVEGQMQTESAISAMIPKIFALAEAYPDLKANTNFLKLQDELSVLESEIANSRRYYNAAVRDFNTEQQTIPSNFIANWFKFEIKPFFKVDEAAREAPVVDFNT